MNEVFCQYLQHLVASVWRKKSFLIMAVMATFLLVICLKYSSVGGWNKNRPKDVLEPQAMKSSQQEQKSSIPRRNLSGLAQNSKVKGRAEIVSGFLPKHSRHLDDEDPRMFRDLVKKNQNPVYLESRHGNDEKMGDNHIKSNDAKFQHRDQDVDSQRWKFQNNAQIPLKQNYIPGYRLVHLDLKGAPPKVSYLKKLFPILEQAGANGILLEYEDMFPFWGPLAPIAAGNAYSKEDIKTILTLAKAHKFEIIPLVQTFGHMEFILKIQNFRHLRELENFPQSVCPSKNESLKIVEKIIDQVLSLHPKTKWLHIGCDEVYHLGYCGKCAQFDRDSLFLKHVSKVANYARQKHSVIPIIWDDMLRNIPTEKLKEFHLGSLVEPMIWTYVKDIYRFVPYNVWITYSEVFPSIWGASAFKGAFGETLTVPNVKMHLENNEAWLETIGEQYKKFESFRGMVLTGWQRYDHFGALCELLPSGVPSLVVNLLTVSQGFFDQQIFKKFHKILYCTVHSPAPVELSGDPYLWKRASGCFFPGSPVFRMTQQHDEAIKKVNDYLYDVTIHKAWLTEYNVRHNMTSLMRVDEGLAEYTSVYYLLTALVYTARDGLREVFDEYTVAEWIEQNIYPYILKMKKLWKDGMDLKKAKVWPRRPLEPLEALKKFSVGSDFAQNKE